MVEMASVVLFASDLGAADEAHDDGPVHAAAELGGVHFAVYQAEEGIGDRAPGWRSASSDFPGFYVESRDDAAARLSALGAVVLQELPTRRTAGWWRSRSKPVPSRSVMIWTAPR